MVFRWSLEVICVSLENQSRICYLLTTIYCLWMAFRGCLESLWIVFRSSLSYLISTTYCHVSTIYCLWMVYLRSSLQTVSNASLDTTLDDDDPLCEISFVHHLDDKMSLTHPKRTSPNYINISTFHLPLPKKYYYKFNVENEKIKFRWQYLRKFSEYADYYID